MTQLERHVNHARYRLWFNRWLLALGWTLLMAAGAWTIALIAARVFGTTLPMLELAYLGAGAAALGAIVWVSISRESRQAAAIAVDEAAGLRERVSSSLYCAQASDPFAQAVVQDAQRVIAGMRVSRLIPIRFSRSLAYAAMMLLAAGGFFWLFPNLDVLGKAKAAELENKKLQEQRRVQTALAKPVEAVKQALDKSAELKHSKDLEELEALLHEEKKFAPDEMKRQVVEKIERLNEQLREKIDSRDAMERMLRQMNQPPERNSSVGKLAEALSQGDFKGAQEQIRQMQEQLAKRDHSAQNAEEIQKMQEQLKELAEKLEQMQDKKTAEKMKQAGVSEKDIQKLAEALSKMDKKEIEKLAQRIQQQMQKQGMSQQQAKQMMQQFMQNQQACQQANQLGQKLSQAAQAMQGNSGEQGNEGLEQSEEMLSEMEQMAQDLNEMESAQDALNDLKEQMSESEGEGEGEGECDCEGSECDGDGSCNGGKGCSKCRGEGDWKKGAGRAFGRREKGGDVNAGFEARKARVKHGKGDIIGQAFVKGMQLKDDQAKAQYEASVEAAEREATDAIDRDKVPMIYQKPIRNYFDRLKSRSAQESKPAADGKAEPSQDASPGTSK